MPEPTPSSYIGFYRDGLTSPEHRRSVTVGRTALLHDTVETLRANASRSTKHHLLFVGLRGMGKTHLLSLIEDEIHADAALAEKYLVARFPEESLRTLSFADFLLGLCEILMAVASAEPIWAQLHAKLHTEEDDRVIVDTLVPAIRKENQARGRTLVVMLENLGEIFSRQMKDQREVAALRKFFMDSKNGCLLVATATTQFSGLTSVDEPFYDFFDVQHLDQLSENESIELVRKHLEWDRREDLLAGFEEMKPRLLALYRMTGGNPRLTVMLSELISRDSVTKVRDQFRILLDRITPFYQDRLNSLPPQERALLETMAVMRDQEKTPTTIAAKMRMKPTHVSSLLKRLTQARLVRSSAHPDDKRTRRYVISEGFFDLWLAMNLSRGARERLPFLLDFFAMFYPSLAEREKKRRELQAQIAATEKQPDALAALDSLSEVGACEEKARAKLHLASIHRELHDEEGAGFFVQEAAALPLDRMGRWIVQRAQAAPTTDYLTEMQDLVAAWDEYRAGNLEAFVRRLGEWGDALSFRSYSQAKLAFLQDHLSEIPLGPTRILLRLQLGTLHSELAEWRRAEIHLRAGLAEAEELESPVALTVTLTNLSLLLNETGRPAEAEPLLRRAIAADEKNFGSDHSAVARDLNTLAIVLKDTGRLGEAEPLMRRALEIDEANRGSEHPKLATRLNNLAHLLMMEGKLEEAEPLLRRALKIDVTHLGSDHPDVGITVNNLAQLLKKTDRLPEAERLMGRALAIAEANLGPAHPRVAVCLGNLAVLMQETGRANEAEPLLRRALAISESSFGSDHPAVARDLNNLAELLRATNRQLEAEPLMRRNVAILLKFTRTTGHLHPNLKTGLRNCWNLWKEIGISNKETAGSIDAMIAEAELSAQQGKSVVALVSEEY